MADLVVIVPSRGRPQAARELAQTLSATCTAGTQLVFAVDADDPTLDDYRQVARETTAQVGVADNDAHTMVCALNQAAVALVNTFQPTPYAVGFLGDDHRPRTVGWDAAYLAALREMGTGIAYGDDLLQGARLPTQCAMTADIVTTLGWMCPPKLRHMYVDNFWRDLGQAAGCLRYLPDVIVEHLHPVAGKAVVDDGYERVNAPAVYAADEATYIAYHQHQLAADVAKIRALPQREPQHEWRLFDPEQPPEWTSPEWYASREHAPHLEEGHRPRMQAAATLTARACYELGADTVVDLGAGDGGTLSLLGLRLRAWGYDLQPSNIQAAEARGVDVRLGDVAGCQFTNGLMRELGDPQRPRCHLGADHAPGHRNHIGDDIGDGPGEPDVGIEWGQVAIATELLEHLVDPHGLVRRIREHAQALVCSSPRDERPGSAYEYHCWAWDMPGYRALLEQGGWRVARHYPVGRFQVALAVRP